MSIFNDKFFNNPDENAFLNWRTDAPTFASFYEIGASFLAQSLITLQAVISNNNEGSAADRFIFSIMFSLWHGIELMLKSGIILCREIQGDTTSVPIDHALINLFSLFEKELDKLNLSQAKNDLKPVKDLIDDFKIHNVSFDAFRYPVNSKWNTQFYNTPDASGIVENVCISVFDLQSTLIEIIENLPEVIKFIEDTVISDGNALSAVNDNSYLKHKKIEKFTEEDFNKNEDPIKIILRMMMFVM